MVLPEPSHEQQAVASAVSRRCSVCVNAVAGSGKSTTVLTIASQNPGLSVLLLSYNRDLKVELRNRVREESIRNLEVHSYHSLAVKHYDDKAHSDEALASVLSRGLPVRRPARFDVVVTDEAQDMTPVFQRLVDKYVADSGSSGCAFVVMGDARQAIYTFKGADARFLTLADRLRPDKNMIRLSLSTSYRLPQKCAEFVNRAVLGAAVIRPARPGGTVAAYRGDVFRGAAAFFSGLVRRLLSTGYAPDDFFVLSPSIKSQNAPYKRLENALIGAGVPCFVPISDDSGLSDKIIRGKVTFTTYHQSKGRERRVVIVYGFDAGYYKTFRSEPRDECPSPLYVAITRASDLLYLVSSEREAPLPFLRRDMSALRAAGLAELHGAWGEDARDKGASAPGEAGEARRRSSVIDLVKFIKPEFAVSLDAMCSKVFAVEDPGRHDVRICNEVLTGGDQYEDVSDINGIAIPAIWENTRSAARPTVHEHVFAHAAPRSGFVSRMLDRIPDECVARSDFLYVANAFLALSNGVHFKMNQIKDYGWLDGADLDTCMGVLDATLGVCGGVAFEVPIQCRRHTNSGPVDVHGRIDALASDGAFEIKCVSALTLEHKLQTVVYKWMHREARGPADDARFVLVNIRTGQRLVCRNDWHLILAVVETLMSNRYDAAESVDDATFVLRNATKM